jgi:hypothetical protein
VSNLEYLVEVTSGFVVIIFLGLLALRLIDRLRGDWQQLKRAWRKHIEQRGMAHLMRLVRKGRAGL